jgi:hypothetical protein
MYAVAGCVIRNEFQTNKKWAYFIPMTNKFCEHYTYQGKQFEFRWAPARQSFHIMRVVKDGVSVGWAKTFSARTYEDGRLQAVNYLQSNTDQNVD